MSKFLFLVGVGRSGTTLLQLLLNSHSKITFLPETHFIKRYVAEEVKKGPYNLKKAKNFLEEVDRDNDLKGFRKPDIQSIINSDNKYVSSSLFRSFFNEFSDEVEYYGDKDPLNTSFISVINRAFPDSRFLQIIRDPRDVILSRIKSEWGKNHSIAYHCADYAYSFNKARKDAFKLPEGKYLEVRYEQLLIEPEKTLKKVCEFLDLEFEERMMNGNSDSDGLIKEREMSWKSNALKPIDKEKVGQWKSKLNESQISEIEFLLKDEIIDLGYDSVNTTNIASLKSRFTFWLLIKGMNVKYG